MTVNDKTLTDALYRVILDSLPWWRKATRAQQSRWKIVAVEAAAKVEAMRRDA